MLQEDDNPLTIKHVKKSIYNQITNFINYFVIEQKGWE